MFVMAILMLSGRALVLLNGIYARDLTTYSFNRTLSLEQLGRLPHAPSVGLHDVPSESVGSHIGLKDYDELDERLAREYSDPCYIPRYSVMELTISLHNFNRALSLRVSTARGSWKHHLRIFG